MREADSPAVVIEDLRVRRGGQPVLPGISLDVGQKKVTGLLGPSGCGKTTLMRAIVGVQRVEGGSVSVLGLPAGSRPLRRRVGYVTQAPSVYRDLTVYENLRYFAQVIQVPRDQIESAIETVDLGDSRERLVRNLSGGQQARVSLATAMLGSPELLVLDEPTVGLDPVLRSELWATFHGFAARGTTLLVSSHVMEEAANCDQLLLMREGRILADETPDQLREQTGEHDLGSAFLKLILDRDDR